MFVRLLFAVGCLLLTVEFIEAKNIYRHKKTSDQFEKRYDDDDDNDHAKHLEARQSPCEDGYRKCPTSSKCIRATWFCDGDNDCGDNSDEQNCECQDGYRKCPTSSRCIRETYFCDRDNDCGDNSDEQNCECQNGYQKCPTSSRCIRATYFCDHDNDCGDYSDEQNCSVVQPPSQPSQPSYPSGPSVGQGGPSEAEMQCLMGMMQVQSTCLSFPLFEELKRLGPEAGYNKLVEIDMQELCGAVQQTLQCATSAMRACSSSDNPMIQAIKQQITAAGQLFEFVCVQEINIINRHKACLLRRDESIPQPIPRIATTFQAWCAKSIPPGFEPTQCIPANLKTCAKDVVGELCGNEIAGVVDRFVSRANSISGCSSYQRRSKSEPLKKRTHAFPFQSSFFQKYFF